MANFYKDLHGSNVPLNPTKYVMPNFDELLGYHFANSLQHKEWWSEAARPGPYVTTFPVALQQAYAELTGTPAHSNWWHDNYEETPMFELYRQSLAQSVELAAANQGWSERDKAALLRYVDEFMQELAEPKHNIGTKMCKDMLMYFTTLSDEQIQDAFGLDNPVSQEGRQFFVCTADFFAQAVPQNTNFESVFRICSLVEDAWSYGLQDEVELLTEAIQTKYPVESALSRYMLDAAFNTQYSTNIPLQASTQADEFTQAIPERLNFVLQQFSIRFDTVAPFKDCYVSWYDFLGDNAEDFFKRCAPEMLERGEQELGCYDMMMGTVEPEQAERGFAQTSQIVDEVFEVVAPLMETLPVSARAQLVGDLNEFYGQTPWDLAGIVQSSMENMRELLPDDEERDDILKEVIMEAHEQDVQFAAQMQEKAPLQKIALSALEDFNRSYENPGEMELTQEQYDAFVSHIYNASMSGQTYQDIVCLGEGYLNKDALYDWRHCVQQQLTQEITMCGYTFENPLGAWVAQTSTTFRGLSLENREIFMQAADAAAANTKRQSSILEEAVAALDEDTREQMQEAIAKDYKEYQWDDIERDDYDW